MLNDNEMWIYTIFFDKPAEEPGRIFNSLPSSPPSLVSVRTITK